MSEKDLTRRDALGLIGAGIGAVILAGCGGKESSANQAIQKPTATKSPEPTVTKSPEPTATKSPEPTEESGDVNHWNRLRELDPTFRKDGVKPWLKEAGVEWESIEFDARQIEEEISPASKILASGVQVDGRIKFSYPVCVTTDDPSRITGGDIRQHQPDLRNASVIYTGNNVEVNGPVTLWVDCSNWEQLK